MQTLQPGLLLHTAHISVQYISNSEPSRDKALRDPDLDFPPPLLWADCKALLETLLDSWMYSCSEGVRLSVLFTDLLFPSSPSRLYEATATKMEPETSQGTLPLGLWWHPDPLGWGENLSMGMREIERKKTGRPEREETLGAHPRLIHVTENPTDGKSKEMSYTQIPTWVHNFR